MILPVEGPDLDEPRCDKPAVEWWRTGLWLQHLTSLCEECAPPWRKIKEWQMDPHLQQISFEEALVMYVHSQ
jgi:hypothetical protein